MTSLTILLNKRMKLENQVVSLELAKKLKELGARQESLFYWIENTSKGWNRQEWHWVIEDSKQPYGGDYGNYRNPVSAFTVAELGEMLPTGVISYKQYLPLSNTTRYICYDNERPQWLVDRYERPKADTEADARAKMLIYLIENNLIK